MLKFICWVTMVCLFPISGIYAQNACIQNLKEAQKSYDQGQITNISGKLVDCMADGFTKSEKLQAHRLIILSYLFLDEHYLAEKEMYNLLSLEPDYVPNKTLDPIEFIQLYNTFRVNPFISFGIMGGMNSTLPRMLNSYGTGNTTEFPTKHTNSFSFQFGVAADILIYRNLFLTVESYYNSITYSSNAKVMAKSEVNVAESQGWLAVPISVKYLFGKSKFKFFIRAGISSSLIVVNQADLVRKSSEINNTEFSGPQLSLSAQKNPLNFSVLGGLGCTYKLGYGFLILDLRYVYGLSNISNISTKYENFNTQITNYGYIESNVALTNFQASIGYMYTLYKVKKIKKKNID